VTIVGNDLSVGKEKWQEFASCKGWDPEVFYPDRGVPSASAKAVCNECPVQRDCLEYALRRDERFGIWGGLSERERRKLHRQRARLRLHLQ
jgi:WhiB family redox-sensing transcriptional regulator